MPMNTEVSLILIGLAGNNPEAAPKLQRSLGNALASVDANLDGILSWWLTPMTLRKPDRLSL
jgi:hypothetical protein